MSVKILGPEIVQKRAMAAQSNNMWFFIELINKQLRTNPINKDGSITVKTPHIINEEFIQKLIDRYKDAGWADVTYEYIYSNDLSPDWTIATFKIQ